MKFLPNENPSRLKITVERSGGFAGIKRVWTAEAASADEEQRWQPVVEACPWDTVPRPDRGFPGGGGPDRFTYNIRAGRHRATVPEHSLTGPWRTLVELAREAAEAAAPRKGRQTPSG
ncbi:MULTISPECIES: protealysin inhibitor emfourin [Arthrobacter]|uniref:protealysin inhibitor emfourin n=1 Tax=Arthrobacter TaxID=1663 RepID=UPI0026BCDF2F